MTHKRKKERKKEYTDGHVMREILMKNHSNNNHEKNIFFSISSSSLLVWFLDVHSFDTRVLLVMM